MTLSRRLVRILPVLGLAAVAVAVFSLGLHQHLTLDVLRDHRHSLITFANANFLAATLSYVGLYILVVAFSLPGATVLTLAGGFLFGVAVGGTLAVVGATLGATALFAIAKGAIGDSLRRRAGPFLLRMEAGFHANAFSYLLFLRLVPAFPFWVVNLVPALLGVSVGTFVAATLLGILPGTFIFASFGSGLGDIFEADGDVSLSSLLSPTLLWGLAGLGFLALLPIAIRKWRSRGR